LHTVYVRWTEKARTRVFLSTWRKCRVGKEGRFYSELPRQALRFALAEMVPPLFHRSCGKVCGKAALERYKFLKILYF
jgi:hypothetical protein